jgi:hypothetical protein
MILTVTEHNWALIAGLMIIAFITPILGWRGYQQSGRGRLRVALRKVRRLRQLVKAAAKASAAAEQKLERLQAKSKTVKPCVMRAAKGNVQDARMKNKLAVDHLHIAENRALKIIVNDFPPNRHEKLQGKYFPDLNVHQKPFTF